MDLTRRDLLATGGFGGTMMIGGVDGGAPLELGRAGGDEVLQQEGTEQAGRGAISFFNATGADVDFTATGPGDLTGGVDGLFSGGNVGPNVVPAGSYEVTVAPMGGSPDPAGTATFDVLDGEAKTAAAVGGPSMPEIRIIEDDLFWAYGDPWTGFQAANFTDTPSTFLNDPIVPCPAPTQLQIDVQPGEVTRPLSVETPARSPYQVATVQEWLEGNSRWEAESQPALFQGGQTVRAVASQAEDGAHQVYVQPVDGFFTELTFTDFLEVPLTVFTPSPTSGDLIPTIDLDPGETSKPLTGQPGPREIGLGPMGSDSPLVRGPILGLTGTYSLLITPDSQDSDLQSDVETILNALIERVDFTTLPAPPKRAKYKVVNNSTVAGIQFRLDGEIVTEVNRGRISSEELLKFSVSNWNDVVSDPTLPPSDTSRHSSSGLHETDAGTRTISIVDILGDEPIEEMSVTFEPGKSYMIKIREDFSIHVTELRTSVMREMKQTLVL